MKTDDISPELLERMVRFFGPANPYDRPFGDPFGEEYHAIRDALPKPADPDVLAVREILHAHQRTMTPPDSGWGNMSYLKGSYDNTDIFLAALAAFRRVTGRGSNA